MFTDLLLLLVLILLNGVFAMSEIAIVSSRRARLLQMADAGGTGARHALKLASEPTRFLSSVQVGITSIGILNGAIGEASIASRLRTSIEHVPVLAPYADTLSLAVMVILLTYVSLILGELVPKRLALTHPEAIASIIARPMDVLATLGRPIVTLLSVSTDTILRSFGVRHVKQPAVTLEEIRVLLEQGADEGVFEGAEHEMVTNVLNLDDRRVGAVLTPRSDVVFLDVRDPLDTNRQNYGRISITFCRCAMVVWITCWDSCARQLCSRNCSREALSTYLPLPRAVVRTGNHVAHDAARAVQAHAPAGRIGR
jgi:putative hemolysin